MACASLACTAPPPATGACSPRTQASRAAAMQGRPPGMPAPPAAPSPALPVAPRALAGPTLRRAHGLCARRERHPRGGVGHGGLCRQRPRLLLERHLLGQFCGAVGACRKGGPPCFALSQRTGGDDTLGSPDGAFTLWSWTKQVVSTRPLCMLCDGLRCRQHLPCSSAGHLNKTAWNYGAIPIIFLFMYAFRGEPLPTCQPWALSCGRCE